MDTAFSILLRLHDTNLTVADPQQDVRTYKVIDSSGKEIGRVEDLLIDDTEKKVRFLLVGSGGFLGLGLGEKKFLIPVDAMTKITHDSVHVNRAAEQVAGGPAYDPKLIDENQMLDHYRDVYTYYGFMPYWGAGYHYPGFTYII